MTKKQRARDDALVAYVREHTDDTVALGGPRRQGGFHRKEVERAIKRGLVQWLSISTKGTYYVYLPREVLTT